MANVPQDTEITLGTGRMLALFFALVVICAGFFAIGFSLGRKATGNVPGNVLAAHINLPGGIRHHGAACIVMAGGAAADAARQVDRARSIAQGEGTGGTAGDLNQGGGVEHALRTTDAIAAEIRR